MTYVQRVKGLHAIVYSTLLLSSSLTILILVVYVHRWVVASPFISHPFSWRLFLSTSSTFSSLLPIFLKPGYRSTSLKRKEKTRSMVLQHRSMRMLTQMLERCKEGMNKVVVQQIEEGISYHVNEWWMRPGNGWRSFTRARLYVSWLRWSCLRAPKPWIHLQGIWLDEQQVQKQYCQNLCPSSSHADQRILLSDRTQTCLVALQKIRYGK